VSTPTNDAALSVLDIHLDRIAGNYLFLQKKLGKGVDCAAAVKADAYGLGAAPVSAALYAAGCRHFYVTTFEEGAALRQLKGLGDDARIYALHGPRGAAPADFTAHRIIPVLNSLEDIRIWSLAAKSAGSALPAVLHIDTGINRLGLSRDETDALVSNRGLLEGLDVRCVMSHLACADTPAHPKNREQLDLFRMLAARLNLPAPLSFANSAGIFLGSDYHFQQARPGCGLYGIRPVAGEENPMQGVITLCARVLQVRRVDRGETVGYAAGYRVATPAKLAIISAGYADGCFRSFSGAGAVFIEGVRCPVVGRISMDVMAVDATEAHIGDAFSGWAEIIGPHQTVDDVARDAGTIGYEVLTALGKRYKRNYSGQ